MKISASILSADFANLQAEVDSVVQAGVDMIHIDVMDGHFVPNITFGAPVVRHLKCDLPFDIHLMIENPENFIKDFKFAPKNSIVSVHAEVCKDLPAVIRLVRLEGFRVCVAINPVTPLSVLDSVVDDLDQVLIMTVVPGYSGQKFMDLCLDKVRELRALKPNLDIEVDGGIDDVTSMLAREAGANVLVSASYLFGASDRGDAVRKMRG